MATKRPSFLKREKERKRQARAIGKREEKQARRRARDEANAAPEAPTDELLPEETPEEESPDDERSDAAPADQEP